jgi:restriction system protein
MSDFLRPASLTPEEFEREVKAMLERSGATLRSFVARQRERVAAPDGEYEIDVTVRFEALGALFLVLVECKHQRRAVEREVVQILADRIRAVGAHKGMLFTTASFQSGALDYARAHGIALVRVADGSSLYMTRSYRGPAERPPWVTLPRCIGVLTLLDAAGRECCTNLDALPRSLLEFLEHEPPA